MKERPILFSSPMVRAILEGRKTQTRRVIKPQPPNSHTKICDCGICESRRPEWFWYHHNPCSVSKKEAKPHLVICPYGKAGDRLWVRESFAADEAGQLTTYMADKNFIGHVLRRGRIKPSIFMRRKESRITLEVVKVRVERVQEISESDAEAEGIWVATKEDDSIIDHAARIYGAPDRPVGIRDYFAISWSRINGPRGSNWHDNPWVWVIEFKRIEQAVLCASASSRETNSLA